MLKININLIIYLFLIFIYYIKSQSEPEITRLKIGLKNSKIIYVNQTIYEIKTNYLHLKLTINNFENIKRVLIADDIFQITPSKVKCPPSSNICQGKIIL